MGLGVIITIYKISKELFSAKAGIWSALMTSLLAPMTYYSKMSNLDVPYIFWSSLAFLEYVRIISSQRLRHYICFGACAALAVATKDQAYGFFVLAPLVILYSLAQQKTGRVTSTGVLGALGSRRILLSLAVAVMVYALANNLVLGGWQGFRRHVTFITGPASKPWRMFPSTFEGQISMISYSTELLIEIFGYGSLFLAIGGICLAIRNQNWRAIALLFFPLSYFIFFFGMVGMVHPRYLLGPSIILTPFAGSLIADLLTRSRMVRLLAMSSVVASLSWQEALTANLTMTLIKDSRYQTEKWIMANIPSGSTIESQVSHERLLPHLSGAYLVYLKGQDEGGRPIPADLSSEALRKRSPQYLLLGSFGFSGDPENWQDDQSIKYRSDLIGGKLGYKQLAKFETPYFLGSRLIVGTRPTFVLFGRID